MKIAEFKNSIALDEVAHNNVVVVDLLFYIHGKHLRLCWDGQLTYLHFSWAGLGLLSG